MTRGRKHHIDPPVNVMVSLPTSLNARVELLLYDPVLQKPKYGGRSALIQILLREWIEKQKLLLTQGNQSAMLNSSPSSTVGEPSGNVERPNV